MFLLLQTRLSKILKVKKDWVTQLKEKNAEAEKMVSDSMLLQFFETLQECG
jgi:hypothetical protein